MTAPEKSAAGGAAHINTAGTLVIGSGPSAILIYPDQDPALFARLCERFGLSKMVTS